MLPYIIGTIAVLIFIIGSCIYVSMRGAEKDKPEYYRKGKVL
jgi:hypothetical protein